MLILTAFCAVVFALIHLLIGRLTFLDVIPRSRWLSAAGGIAVAYVFLHILPEFAAHQATFAEALGTSERTAEVLIYLTALVGLATFYGLERAAKVSRKRSRERAGEDAVEAEIFWLHVGSFGLYNLLIGYLLLHREEPGLTPLFMYSVAMALHFLTSDFGLRDDHKRRYDRAGRWVIAVSVIAGWLLGASTEIPELAVAFLFAFLAGGVVLNVLKEELPEDRQSRFLPFLLGAAGYAVLLIVG